jgi:DNA-binding CsgD family transcriptional regulator
VQEQLAFHAQYMTIAFRPSWRDYNFMDRKPGRRTNVIVASNSQLEFRDCPSLEVALATVSPLSGLAGESFRAHVPSKPRLPFGKTPRSVVRLLSHSTIGIALFDRNLYCRAFNGALGSMIGISIKEHLGKQLHQVFPGGATKLEIAFRRVWTTRRSLSNLELTAQLPPGTATRRWVVNFYPITDELGRVRLVATTFSEVTKGRGVELKLSRLKDKFHSDAGNQSNVLAEEFSALSERTFEIVNRSIALLKGSLSLRFYMSAMRLEAQLLRHALFITPSPLQESCLFASPAASDAAPTPDSGLPYGSKLAASSPSPRERQILCLLTDGKSNKEIASVLAISTRTVECYRARIMLKLDLHSTAALVRYAIRNKIIEA